MIYENIAELLCYGLQKGLLQQEDVIYTYNRLLEALELPGDQGETLQWVQEASRDLGEGREQKQECSKENGEKDELLLEPILQGILEDVVARGIIEDGITSRDLFDTKIMGLLLPRPSMVIGEFWDRYRRSPKEATDFYYTFSQDTDYIRRYRVCKDLKWTTPTSYGTLDITVNLSKPEKDPKAIAAARTAGNVAYPKCQLCRENEGYAGRLDHPARQNHRIIPITIQGADWCFQYSPYVYYNEHCIVFCGQHVPMAINRATFGKLFDFVKQFPHYFVGSNADLPIVGGSILTHDHFQGGNYEFAMAKAPVEETFSIAGFEGVSVGRVKWPMSVLRLEGPDTDEIIDLADHILKTWRGYSDPAAEILAKSDGEPHNTITPIARKKGELYQLDLVLRNNRTTPEHPLGLFHPHSNLHHIKKENIGLIEVMGLAVLPARLKQEMDELAEALCQGEDITQFPNLEKHAPWVAEFWPAYHEAHSETLTKESVWELLKEEIGLVFEKVLQDAGVYKDTEEGREAFRRFVEVL